MNKQSEGTAAEQAAPHHHPSSKPLVASRSSFSNSCSLSSVWSDVPCGGDLPIDLYSTANNPLLYTIGCCSYIAVSMAA